MPAATSSTSRSRISTSSRATARESEGVDARPARRRGLAAAQGADEGAHPRDRRRADQDRRRARAAPRRGARARHAAIAAFVDRFPYEETDDQDRAIADVLDDLAAGKPMDRLVCGDVGFGKTEVALRAAFVAAMAGHAGRAGRARPPCSPASISTTSPSASRASRSRSAGSRASSPPTEAKETREGLADGQDRHRHRHPRAARQGRRVQEPRPGHRRRGAALRRHPQGAAEGAARPTSTS